MKTTRLESRLQGATRPGVVFTLTDDDGAIDTTLYVWTMKGALATTGVTAWTKSSGLTASPGGQLAVTWSGADLGACTVPAGKTAADWELELIGTSGSGARKYKLLITIEPVQT